MSTTKIGQSSPEFAVAIRGYDRLQVDDYLARLQRLLDEAEERARDAEAQLMSDSAHASVGSRVGEIFELALAEAREVRTAAEQEARGRVAAARASAEEILEEARAKAERITQESRAEQERLQVEYEDERARLRERLEELDRRRLHVLGELRRLYELLGSAAGVGLLERDGAAEDATTEVVAVERLPELPEAAAG
jgi:cell division septum initiation protein DivIVA